jgi:uncharacterized protein YuzE
MKINYDKQLDSLYIFFKKSKVAKTFEIEARLIVDTDKKGDVVGIELLDARDQLEVTNFKKEAEEGIPFDII